MSDTDPATLVAEIRDLYTQRNELKRQIQIRMLSLHNDHGWTQREIADETGIPKSTVDRWLQAAKQGLPHMGQALTPPDHRARSDRAVTRRVLSSSTPAELKDLVKELPEKHQGQLLRATSDVMRKDEKRRWEEKMAKRSAEEIAAGDQWEASYVAPIADGLANMAAEALVINHLNSATDELTKAMDMGALSGETVRKLIAAHASFEAVLDLVCLLVGIERP